MATTVRETRAGSWDVVVEHLNKVPFCSRAYAAAPVLAVNHHLFGHSAFAQVAWPIAAGVVMIERLIPRVYRDVPFLAVSESSRRDLIERGIPGEHIDLLYNGIVPPAREPTPVSERPLRVAYLGRLERYKRIDLLVRACAQLAEHRPDLELVVVGRGAESARLEALAAELGLSTRARFTGFVSDAERDALLAGARVAVCPSVKEGWGSRSSSATRSEFRSSPPMPRACGTRCATARPACSWPTAPPRRSRNGWSGPSTRSSTTRSG